VLIGTSNGRMPFRFPTQFYRLLHISHYVTRASSDFQKAEANLTVCCLSPGAARRPTAKLPATAAAVQPGVL